MANPYVSSVTLTSVVDILFQEWNGAFFEKKTLCELGLRVQLGHGGSACPCAIPGPTDFTLFDTNGVHHVNIDYCDCIQPPAPPKRVQLLRMWWFPASNDRPRTAFTFDVLEHFHKLTRQGKTTLYDYYHAILQITDSLQLEKIVASISGFYCGNY